MPARQKKILKKRALRLHQDGRRPLFLFSLTGDELLKIADISRISRTDTGKLLGYQRPAVRKHIEDIVLYLNSDDIIFPNSIILSLSGKTRFVRNKSPRLDDTAISTGVLEIPWPGRSKVKPAWIVDGQQRAMAISMSKKKDLAVPINAFVTDEVDLQRDQFLRVNNIKPLPRGLITELLPEVPGPLPAKLVAKKIPSAVCDQLNRRSDSPFFGLIRRASSMGSAKRNAVVADASIVKMLEESINSPSGCLFPYQNIATGEADLEGIWRVLVTYWTAVKNTFPEAWAKPPRKSRLMHGAGLRAMGRLMDRVMSSIELNSSHRVRKVERHLKLVAPMCHWTSGSWDALGGLRWNEIQNVPRHINLLSNALLRAYINTASR